MPYDSDQINNLDAELDALTTPTTFEVFEHSKDYNPDIVSASAARRAINGGGGGGSLTVTQERFDATTTVAPLGLVQLDWAHSFGDALLDYTDPSAPTVIAAGTYALSIFAMPNGTYNSIATSSYMHWDVEMDSDNDDWDQHASGALIPGMSARPAVPAAITAKIPTAAVLKASFFHDADISLGILLRGQIAKLG